MSLQNINLSPFQWYNDKIKFTGKYWKYNSWHTAFVYWHVFWEVILFFETFMESIHLDRDAILFIETYIESIYWDVDAILFIDAFIESLTQYYLIYWDIHWDYLLRRWRNTIYSLRRPPLLFAFTSALPCNELAAELWPFFAPLPHLLLSRLFIEHILDREEVPCRLRAVYLVWNIELKYSTNHKKKNILINHKNDWLYTR